MPDSLETLEGGPSAALPLPVPPADPSGRSLAESDAELYDAWRKHIERGFENNNRMFDRTLNAFMYPYWVTVGMYIVLFVVGISAFFVAARLSFEGGKELYTVLFGGIGAVAFLTSRLSGRAAFIHVGALLGTCMAGNVFLHIIPSQRELVAATVSGRDQDPRLSWRAKQRSIHNNYMTFPLLFLMLSSHFSSTFGHAHRAVVLGVLMVAGASVRHVLNIRFTFPAWKPTLAAVLTASIVALYLLLVPRGGVDAMAAFRGGPPVTFGEARTVLQQRCVTCHSATPKDAVFTTAPNGVVFDAPEQIHLYADRIMARAVLAKTMPLANRTGMTDEERAILGRWVAQGARVE